MAKARGKGRITRNARGEPYTRTSAAKDAEETLRFLEGRWKLAILFQLFGGEVRRFSYLERALPSVSEKMLSHQLRRMQADGLVRRTAHQEIPPKVEYSLTDWGEELCPVLDALLKWAARRPPSGTQAPVSR